MAVLETLEPKGNVVKVACVGPLDPPVCLDKMYAIARTIKESHLAVGVVARLHEAIYGLPTFLRT